MFMTALQWVNTAIVIIGIPSGVGGLIYAGRKLEKIDNLEHATKKIKANIKVISDHLIRTSGDFNHEELQGYSPLQLTDQGRMLIHDLGFEDIFSKHREDFFNCITHDEPKQKYDVEVAAIKSISVLSNNDYMSFLKKFFYNNPDRNLQNTAPTLGIYVRDRYLEKYPDIED